MTDETTMTDATKTIGAAVTVDVGTPGTCGYKPAQTGTIIGYVIKLDTPIDFSWGRETDTTRYVITAAEWKDYESSRGTFSSNS
jgi:hypothetical protein